MRPLRTLVALGGASALLLLTSVSIASANGGNSSAEVLLTDLSSPKGLDVNADKNLVVAQGAFGPPGAVLNYVLSGPDAGTVVEVTEPFTIVDVAISPKDGTGWAIGTADDLGQVVLFHQLADGTIVPVLNITEYQAGDPDPVDQEGVPTESNPYGLTIMRNGNALVADAAGNDVIRVTPDGHATTVARFDVETVSTDHIPGFPFPTQDAEAVPTTVTIGPDGAIYVGELKGFPFRPGTSNIWRIKPNAEGAWCSVNSPDPSRKCELYSSGYTAIQDIAFNNNNGRLYVYELAADGTLAFEEGFATGEFPPAVLLEVKKAKKGDTRIELAAGQLSQPGGIVIVKNGIYVTDGLFTSGRLLRIDAHGK